MAHDGRNGAAWRKSILVMITRCGVKLTGGGVLGGHCAGESGLYWGVLDWELVVADRRTKLEGLAKKAGRRSDERAHFVRWRFGS